VTATEAAARLDLSYDFVLRLLRLGKLVGFHNRRKWHVDKDSVNRYLKQRSERRARRVMKYVQEAQ
jgi:excisionase family DNA binding protein